MSEWRDIATAPRDGTWVLIAAVDLHPCDAQWARDDFGDNEGWFDAAGFFSTQPTHWQPLPEPPSIESKTADESQMDRALEAIAEALREPEEAVHGD